MIYNEIGKTGMVVSNLGFGASSLGGVFRGTSISSFTELKYFTGITKLSARAFSKCIKTNISNIFADYYNDAYRSVARRL